MKSWTCDEGKIYLGDCLKVLKSLPAQSVDLVFGSPPYEAQRTYGIEFNLKGQDWVDWMVEVFEASLRVSKGLVAFVVGHGTTKRFKWSATPALLIADLHRKGICLRDPKWFKRVGIPGSGGPDDMRKDIEFVVCATAVRGELPWSNNLACAKPWKYQPGGRLSHRTKDGKRVYDKIQTYGYKDGDAQTQRTKRSFKTEAANPGNVIDCGSVGGGHLGSNISHDNEAPFPEKLADFFIRSYCPPGGTVVDPFAGSGTVPGLAVQTGRRFIAIDIRDSQIKLIQRRIKQSRKKKGFGLNV